MLKVGLFLYFLCSWVGTRSNAVPALFRGGLALVPLWWCYRVSNIIAGLNLNIFSL